MTTYRTLVVALLILLVAPLAEAQGAQRNCPQFTSDFGLGSRDATTGGAVSELQRFLARSPALYPEGLVTGYYGNLTKRAVQRFQASKGISQTGYVGPLTRDAIARSCTSPVSTSNTPVSFVVSPITGAPPLTVSYQMNFGNRSCNEEFILDAGDGSMVSSKSANSFQTCGAVTLKHIYTSIGTYLAKLDKVLTVQGVSTRQTVASANVNVAAAAQQNTAVSISFSAPQAGSNIKRGGNVPISWASQNAPSGSKVRLEIYPVGTAPSTGNNDSGLSSELSATGSYNWTVPSQGSPILADSGLVSGLPNGQYRIVAKLYSGSGCWGFCSTSDRTIHATAESASFSIVAGEPPVPGVPLSTYFSVNPTNGASPLTVSFSTKFPATRPENPKYYIDFDDTTAEWVADCSGEGCSTPGVNTHIFSKSGVFDVWLVMRTFEASCPGENDCPYTDKTIARQSITVDGFGSGAGTGGSCFLDGVGYPIQEVTNACSQYGAGARDISGAPEQCKNLQSGQMVCTQNGWSGPWAGAYINPSGVAVGCKTANAIASPYTGTTQWNIPGNMRVQGNRCTDDATANALGNACTAYYICKRDGWWRTDSTGTEIEKVPAPWILPEQFYPGYAPAY